MGKLGDELGPSLRTRQEIKVTLLAVRNNERLDSRLFVIHDEDVKSQANGQSSGNRAPLLGMWLAPRATFRSGSRWRFVLLQCNFLIGIGPDDQVRNISFDARPPMRHAAGDDDHIALSEPA